MECCREVLLDAKFCREGFPEVGCEAGISVADDLAGESEPSIDVVEI
jgi:hypothetical protein